MFTSRTALRATAAAGLTAGLIALSTSPAAAHVGLDPSATGSGERAVLAFSFGHGCDGSPTESLEIQLPEEILTASPIIQGGWSIDVNTSELDEPVEQGHSELTERVDSVVFTADDPVVDELRGVVEMQVTLPEVEPGTVLEFPTIQSCTEGETGWVQSTTDGSEPDSPAPAFTVTGGSSDGAEDTSTSNDEATASTGTSASSNDGGGSNTVAWVGVGLGAAGLLAGGAALAGSRRAS